MINRKVEIISASFATADGDGIFLSWGIDYDELNNGDAAGMRTVAIVEHPSGRVELIRPECIRFTGEDA